MKYSLKKCCLFVMKGFLFHNYQGDEYAGIIYLSDLQYQANQKELGSKIIIKTIYELMFSLLKYRYSHTLLKHIFNISLVFCDVTLYL